jgi:hypothetical protein
VTILIRIDRIGDPDRIEIGSILRKISSDPTIIDRISTGDQSFKTFILNYTKRFLIFDY